MNGWKDRWVNEWMDGWVEGWIDEWMEGWMDGQTDGWTDGWMEGCLIDVLELERELPLPGDRRHGRWVHRFTSAWMRLQEVWWMMTGVGEWMDGSAKV